MLSLVIFLPLSTALVVLAIPARRRRLVGGVAVAGAAATLLLALLLAAGFDPDATGFGWRTTLPWIPPIGASYDVAVTGLSLPLLLLTALLLLAALVYAFWRSGSDKLGAFLFLLMETGLLGVFAAQDLLLFYLFFEVGLVPMYFIIGVFGHQNRRYAALKFFLYTRLASLAMLLGFLSLYLSMEPHTFSLPAIAAARPLAGGGALSLFAFFALLCGFAVKIPAVPLHNWLPDAHVEAPAEGSAVLAGVQLKMGGYGLLFVLLRAMPETSARMSWVFIGLALASLTYGALAALGQRDLKRLVAFTSVSHMGFILLAAGVIGLSMDAAVRSLAMSGAVYQMVSHGLLTGAMFLMVGMLAEQGRTRDLDAYGGLFGRVPLYAAVFAVLAFGSFGIPGMSGFAAELQVLSATVSVSVLCAVVAALSILVLTGLYLRVITRLLLRDAPAHMPPIERPAAPRIGTAAALAALSIALGIAPGPLVNLLVQAIASLGVAGGA